jgi:hypothetical protein
MSSRVCGRYFQECRCWLRPQPDPSSLALMYVCVRWTSQNPDVQSMTDNCVLILACSSQHCSPKLRRMTLYLAGRNLPRPSCRQPFPSAARNGALKLAKWRLLNPTGACAAQFRHSCGDARFTAKGMTLPSQRASVFERLAYQARTLTTPSSARLWSRNHSPSVTEKRSGAGTSSCNGTKTVVKVTSPAMTASTFFVLLCRLTPWIVIDGCNTTQKK